MRVPPEPAYRAHGQTSTKSEPAVARVNQNTTKCDPDIVLPEGVPLSSDSQYCPSTSTAYPEAAADVNLEGRLDHHSKSINSDTCQNSRIGAERILSLYKQRLGGKESQDNPD